MSLPMAIEHPLTPELKEIVEDAQRRAIIETILETDTASRRAAAALAAENAQLHEQLSYVLDRCSKLLLQARDFRKRIIELGGEDPGIP